MSKIIDYELGIPDYRIDTKDQLEFTKLLLKKQSIFYRDFDGDKILEKIKVEKKNICIYPNDMFSLLKKTYQEKMIYYKEETFYLATKTVDKLLKRFDKNEITHIIAVSSTGTYAPFLQDRLANYFNLDKTCKRIVIQCMGCHAGVKAMDLAHSYANEKENNTVLVVCVELCSIHKIIPKITDPINKIIMELISNLLFGDGCSSFIISSNNKYKNGYPILSTITYNMPNTEKYLSWEMGKNTFVMNLDKLIINSIKLELVNAINELKKKYIFDNNDMQIIAHPGGPSILKTIIETLNLDNNALDSSYNVLKQYGNMSSCTIMFVLNEYIKKTHKDNLKKYMLVVAFGPGMTIEMVLLNVNNEFLIDECEIENNIYVTKYTVRSLKKKIIDRPLKYTCLYTQNDLDKVFEKNNNYSPHSSFLSKINNYNPKTLLDIGIGKSLISKYISSKLPHTQINFIDINEKYIDIDNKYDIITCVNICHNMKDDEFIEFIKYNYEKTLKSIIIVDLERKYVILQNFLWKILTKTILPVSNLEMDGYTEISKSFTRNEITELLLKSGIAQNNIEIKTLWPFRMMITINKDSHIPKNKFYEIIENIQITIIYSTSMVLPFIRCTFLILPFICCFAFILLTYFFHLLNMRI